MHRGCGVSGAVLFKRITVSDLRFPLNVTVFVDLNPRNIATLNLVDEVAIVVRGKLQNPYLFYSLFAFYLRVRTEGTGVRFKIISKHSPVYLFASRG